MEYDPYASHLKILETMCYSHVLEIGGGKHSTVHFLSKPYLKELVTVEANAEWRVELLKLCTDARWDLRSTIPLDLTPFDLIFIDNGEDANPQARVRAIEQVAQSELKEGVRVIVHDFENQFYQHAALPFPHVEIDRELTPWTAILWR